MTEKIKNMKMTIGPNDTQYLDDMKFVKYECFCDNAEIESVVIEKGVEGPAKKAVLAQIAKNKRKAKK